MSAIHTVPTSPITYRFRAAQVEENGFLLALSPGLLRRESTKTAKFSLQFGLKLPHGLLRPGELLWMIGQTCPLGRSTMGLTL